MVPPGQVSDYCADLGDAASVAMVSDSWSTGWRSALLREYECMPEVDELEISGLPDQLLVMVLSGEKEIESFDGSRWQRAVHGPGHLAMTAPGKASKFRWRVQDSESLHSLHLYLPGDAMRTAVKQVWDCDPDGFAFPDTLDTGDIVVQQVMLSMRDAHRRGLPDQYAEAATAFLAAHLVSTHISQKRIPMRPVADLHVDRAKEFMVANSRRQVTLADVADSVHLSVFHFSRLFKKSTGTSSMQWLTEYRLQAARTRLRSSSDSLEVVALECGFSSARQFSTCFARHMGVSPTTFRRG